MYVESTFYNIPEILQKDRVTKNSISKLTKTNQKRQKISLFPIPNL